MNIPKTNPSPLGIFDSGLGGLTVVRSIARSLPGEPMVYFGDTARVPYGNKSETTVTRLSLEALRFLEPFGIKMLVVACNSASAVALDALESHASIPVLGVVEAGARRALETTRNGRVGIIGTRATVASQCYERAIAQQRPEVQAFSNPCPLFVPLVEEGWGNHPTTRVIATEYLEPLIQQDVDTLILGCTHYPLLSGLIGEIMGERVTLIDSGDAVAIEVRKSLVGYGLLAPETAAPERRFFVSDQAEKFHQEGQRFLGNEFLGSVEAVDQSMWHDSVLRKE